MGTTTQPIKNKKDLLNFRNYYKVIKKKPRNYALIVLGLNSALRIGDLLSLHWQQVYNSKTGQYCEHISIIEEKTNKQNTIAINSAITEALDFYRHSLDTIKPADYIFPSQKSPYKKLSRSQAFRLYYWWVSIIIHLMKSPSIIFVLIRRRKMKFI